MMTFAALLGSADGPRLDLLVKASSAILVETGGKIIEASDVYVQRGCEGLKGVYANSVILVAAPKNPSKDMLRSIEHRLGRIRDAERSVPHTIDIDILAFSFSVHDSPVVDKSRLGRPYALFGLSMIEERFVRDIFLSITKEQDIDHDDVQRWFYPIASRSIFTSLIR